MSRWLAAAFVLVVVLLSAAPGALAQNDSGRRSRRAMPRADARRTTSRAAARRVTRRLRTPLEISADEIMAERPEVSDETIYDDMEVVQDALPDINRIFRRRGQGETVAQAYTLAGWKKLRVERLGPAERMSIELLTGYVVRLGTLVIKSTPTGASIELDGKNSGVTENVIYSSSGSYRVRLTLDGYESVEETCSVTEGQMTEVNKKLKPLPRRRSRLRP